MGSNRAVWCQSGLDCHRIVTRPRGRILAPSTPRNRAALRAPRSLRRRERARLAIHARRSSWRRTRRTPAEPPTRRVPPRRAVGRSARTCEAATAARPPDRARASARCARRRGAPLRSGLIRREFAPSLQPLANLARRRRGSGAGARQPFAPPARAGRTARAPFLARADGEPLSPRLGFPRSSASPVAPRCSRA